ncbi:MAG: type II secretion system protein [Candidatus Dojkabacteria bacterium]
MIDLNMTPKYKAFTLVELLIVMGILIILITMGILVARYAMWKSQDTKHKDSARKLYTMLLEYKNDNGNYPELGNCSGCITKEFFANALGSTGNEEDHMLVPYSEGEAGFDGGGDATYYYGVDTYDQQFVIICVSLGGIDDEYERGYYCVGSGIGMLPEYNPIPYNDIGSQRSGDMYSISVKSLDDSDWKPKEGGFSLSN